MISMTRREFATLVYLAKHPSWVFSAGQIYEEVWGEDSENCGTAVASVIGQIRRKLTPDMPKAGYIRTVLGSGYKFEVPQDIAELNYRIFYLRIICRRRKRETSIGLLLFLFLKIERDC